MSEVLLNPQPRCYLLLLTLWGLLQERKVRVEVNCPLAELDTAPSALPPPCALSRALEDLHFLLPWAVLKRLGVVILLRTLPALSWHNILITKGNGAKQRGSDQEAGGTRALGTGEAGLRHWRQQRRAAS